MKHVRDIPASVLSRLKNISRKENQDFQFVLGRYATERFLYRLSKSKYKEQFILKGAMLFLVWMEQFYRPTSDVDFFGYGDGSNKRLKNAINEICKIDVEADGAGDDAALILDSAQKYSYIDLQYGSGRKWAIEPQRPP